VFFADDGVGACLRTALRLRAPLRRPLCGFGRKRLSGFKRRSGRFGPDSTLVRGGFTHLWIKKFLNATHPQPPSRHWT